MSSYSEDFRCFLTVVIAEQWVIRKVQSEDGLVKDYEGRNLVLPLEQQDVDYLQKEGGYQLFGPGEYELIAPPNSGLLEYFPNVKTAVNIFDADAQA